MYKYFFILSAVLIGCSDANFTVPDIADSNSDTCVKLTCGSNNCDKMSDGCGGELDCTKSCSAGQACGGTAFDSSRNLLPKTEHMCSGTCVDITSLLGDTKAQAEVLNQSCGGTSYRFINCSNETKYISSTIKTCKPAVNFTPASGVSYWCCPTSTIQ